MVPVIFMEGPAFCEAFHLKASDPRCAREWVTEESHVKITLPVSPSVKLFEATPPADRDCIGSMAAGGSCPVDEKRFLALAKEFEGDFLVAVTVTDGTITRIAQEFRP